MCTYFGIRGWAYTAASLALFVAACESVPVDGGDDGGNDAAMVDDCAGAVDGTPCDAGSICLAGACVTSTCGDGVVDAARGEDCDDMNDATFDGCEPDTCAFTC